MENFFRSQGFHLLFAMTLLSLSLVATIVVLHYIEYKKRLRRNQVLATQLSGVLQELVQKRECQSTSVKES